MLRNTNDYYVSVHRKKLYPHFHLHWCPLQRFFYLSSAGLLPPSAPLKHLQLSNKIHLSLFQPACQSIAVKKNQIESGSRVAWHWFAAAPRCRWLWIMRWWKINAHTANTALWTVHKICPSYTAHTTWHVLSRCNQYLFDNWAQWMNVSTLHW